MRRYSLYCENLPEGSNYPTFMQFVNMPNSATGVQSAMLAKAAGRSFASRDELEGFLGREQRSMNDAPVADFEGVSPAQMQRLLDGTIDSIPEIVAMTDAVPDDAALEVPVIRQVRWFLGYLADHDGEVKLTGRGNLPRAMCARFLDEHVSWWHAGDSVPSEPGIFELVKAHEVALNAGFIDETPTRIWITTEGAGVYAAGRWGGVWAELFRSNLNEMDWPQWLGESLRHEHFTIVQDAFPFVLRLLHHHPTGTPDELTDRFATAFPAYFSPGGSDARNMQLLRSTFRRLVLHEVCEPFGLVQLTVQEPDDDGPFTHRYETTRLFREAFEWRG